MNKGKVKEYIKELIGINVYDYFVAVYHKFDLLCIARYFLRYLKHRFRHSIIVIGDSHANFFSGNEQITWKPLAFAFYGGVIYISKDLHKNFDALHVGPALAYNMNKYGTTIKAREKVDYLRKHFLCKGDTIICVFGEIDLRVHVMKQVEKENKNYKDIVNDILSNYMNFLTDLSGEGYKVWCWGAIASQKDDWVMNLEFPRNGTEKERNIATEYFNKQLEKLCKANNIGFITIFPYLITPEYTTKEQYIADECHLSQKAWVYAVEEFKKQKLFETSVD